MTETLGLTAERCVELLDAREVSCRELATAYLDRIEAADGGIHAFLRTRREAALAEADGFDRAGRTGLQGVPIALKDILCTKGEETTAGSRILEGYIPIYDGGCVTRVKAAGLVALGKTRTPRSASPTTRGTPTASRAARRAARRRRSPPASRRSRSAPTPAARSASPRLCAASSA
jgi:Asp-tRNA(Asn)/Glu-tRNA(Gln) amidotransferase A subunit family amidase